VGSFAVQLAKASGAEVTGVCRTSKTDLVRSLGADHVLDYTREDVSDGRHRYALVVVGGETAGRWLGGFDRSLRPVLLSPLVSQRLGALASRESAEDLLLLRDLLQSGQVIPAVDRAFTLSETPTAITYLAEGHARGKIIITLWQLGSVRRVGGSRGHAASARGDRCRTPAGRVRRPAGGRTADAI